MDNCNIDILDEILNILGYEKDENLQKECKYEIDPSGGASDNCCANLNLDIEGGFQDIDPIAFVTIGDILGNMASARLPFNVANSVSNFLLMVGQIIETYASQQQYQQGGPGRLFNPVYKNIQNPFCSSVTSESGSTSDSDSDDMSEIKEQITDMSKRISEIENKLAMLENSINEIKK